MADYNIYKAFEKIEDELVASMMRNIRHHRAEETKEGYNWSQWQVEQINALEEYRNRNAKKFGKEFSKINKQISGLIREVRAEGGMAQEEKILKAIQNGFKGKKVSKGARAKFFKMNDKKMDALIKATTDDLKKAETAVLRMSNDQYRKIIYNSQVYATSGAGTYEQAVDMATKEFLNAGLNCVEYKNGARHTLKEYADMSLRTANKRAYLTGEGEKRQEWGISTVVMNKRGNACPKCLPFVGKVLVDDVWSGGKPDGEHMLMSTAIAAGLYHPRCKDNHTTYFHGISDEGAEYTKEDLAKISNDYNKEQKQKYVQHEVERFGRLAKYSLDPSNKQKYSFKANEWRNKLVDKSLNDGIIKAIKTISGHESNPKTSDAFDIINHIGKNNKIETRSYYNELGQKITDITNHNHNLPKTHAYGQNGEHAHDYTWENGEIVSRTTREITDKERKENNDIL